MSRIKGITLSIAERESKMSKKSWKWNPEVPVHFVNFGNTMADLDTLLKSHVDHFMDGAADGEIREESETVFIRSAVLLLCATWEAYVEDLLTASVTHLLEKTSDPDKLPTMLRRAIARKLEADKNELASWQLAGEGWRTIVKEFLSLRVGSLHSPKSENIKRIYEEFLGLDILECWNWTWSSKERGISDVEFDRANTIYFIDHMVSVRGGIAHGRPADQPITNFLLMNYGLRVHKLLDIMHNYVANHLESLTGETPWKRVKSNIDLYPLLKVETA